MEYRTFKTADEAAQAVGDEVARILAESASRGTPTLLLLSGGSSLRMLEHLSAESIDGRVTIAPLDDRYDPTGAKSNSRMIKETAFYRDAIAAAASYLDSSVREGESRDELATRLDTEIRKWLIEHQDGEIIGTLGVGDDGHTAGIFPDADPRSFAERFSGERLYVGYRGSETAINPERVTATFTLIGRIGHPLVYFAGPSKALAWRESIAEGVDAHDRPAAFYRDLANVIVFSSDAA